MPFNRRFRKNYALLTQIIKDYIDSKEGAELTNNLFDYMIKYNRKHKDSPEEQMTLEDLVGNFLVFMSAGTDTTRYSTMNSIKVLAENQDVQDNLRKMVSESKLADFAREGHGTQGSYTFEDAASCRMLIHFLYETIRTTAISPISSLKTLHCDTTLGKYNLKKGDQVMIVSAFTDEQHFPNPSKIDLDRYRDMSKWTHEENMKF